jgi:hypothetical protein
MTFSSHVLGNLRTKGMKRRRQKSVKTTLIKLQL